MRIRLSDLAALHSVFQQIRENLYARAVARLAVALLPALLHGVALRHAQREIEAEELGVLAEERQLRRHQRAEALLERAFAREHGVDALVQLADGRLERFLDQLIAVAEVEIDRSLGDAGLAGDLRHRGGGHPL